MGGDRFFVIVLSLLLTWSCGQSRPVTMDGAVADTLVCQGELLNCNGKCVDTETNAGACTCGCPSGQISCGKPVPAPNCLNGQITDCLCVDPQSDDNNCGSCGNVCASGQTCVSGQCA